MLDQILVGTYTGDAFDHVDGRADGILVVDHRDGLQDAVIAARVVNPSWLTATDDGGHVYAVIETTTYAGKEGGAVAAFRRDPADGTLTLLNERSSLGIEPAHVAVDPTGRFVLVANYGDGSVTVHPRLEDGSLGAPVAHVRHAGSSVHPVRQSGPHAHQIVFDPKRQRLLVPDLGRDEVLVYDFGDDGSLKERPELAIRVAPGAGPRHVAWHPAGDRLFVLNELDSTLSVYRRDGDGFTGLATVSTLPEDFTGHNQSAAVRVHPDGVHVFASNRGHDSIAVLVYDAASEGLTLLGTEPTQGLEPRDFVLTPDASRLIVANQDSDTLVEFDLASATLRHRSTASAATPVCLLLV